MAIKKCGADSWYDDEKTDGVQPSDCNDLLYGVVEWFKDYPVLDGMPYFETDEKALEYANKQAETRTIGTYEPRYTIIRLVKAV